MNSEPRPLYDWEITASAECVQGRMVTITGQDADRSSQQQLAAAAGGAVQRAMALGQDEGVKETLNVRFVGNLQRVEVKPGDRFVLMVDGELSEYDTETFRAQLKEFFKGSQVLVLGKGTRLGVVGAATDDGGTDV